MANTIDFILTNSAQELTAKVLNGKTLNFTRMAIGDGFAYDTTVAKGFTTLVNEVLSLDITKKEILNAESVKITSAFSNTDANSEFYYREVGLFAEDPDTKEEVLYAYGNRNDAAELITHAGNNIVTKQLMFIVTVGDSANVTFNVNQDIYALQTDMVDVQTDINQVQTDIEGVQNNITTLQTGKADKNLVNTGMITNCLLEVPRHIKLELSNGFLTLKAGSKVYIPNGFEADGTTPKFDEVITNKDCIGVPLVNEVVKYFMYCENIAWASENTIQYSTIFYTGNTTPVISTGPNYFWYNTANNKIMTTADGGVTWKESRVALPICRGTYASIDQVFNGFGYVGSIAFALPGIKCLIPNGRNADGTLNNIEYTLNTVKITSSVGTYDRYLFFENNSITGAVNYYVQTERPEIGLEFERWFDVKNNSCLYHEAGGTYWKIGGFCVMGKFSTVNGAITTFKPNVIFRATDYNEYHTKITELEARLKALESTTAV